MAKDDKTTLVHEIEELSRDNEKLKEENIHLKDELGHQPARRPAVWRSLAISICVLLATVSLIAGNVLFWAGNTLVNSDRYIQTVQPLLKDSAIQAAIADYTTAKLFNQVDVTAVIQQALPPRADFLAPALTAQLKNATGKTLQSVLASNRFQSTWVNVNRTAHDRLISSLKNSNSDGVVNLQDVYDTLGKSLDGSKLSFLAGKDLPKNIGSITVINAPWVPKARFVVNSVGWLKPVSLLLVGIFSAAAIWLSRRRRATVITIGAFISIGMIASLLGAQAVRAAFVAKAAPAYHTAAEHAGNIVLHHLVVQSLAILCIGVAISLIAWITGPYSYASWLRRAVEKWATSPLHRLIWTRENDLTHWLASYRQGIEWGIVGAVAILTLLSEISPREIIWRTVLILLIVLVIETIAAPRNSKKPR